MAKLEMLIFEMTAKYPELRDEIMKKYKELDHD